MSVTPKKPLGCFDRNRNVFSYRSFRKIVMKYFMKLQRVSKFIPLKTFAIINELGAIHRELENKQQRPNVASFGLL